MKNITQMKRTKQYEAPKSEVIEMDIQGVLCLSNPITGGVMVITDDTVGGVWIDTLRWP